MKYPEITKWFDEHAYHTTLCDKERRTLGNRCICGLNDCKSAIEQLQQRLQADKKMHLVELPDLDLPWHAVYDNPIQGKNGTGFKTADFANEYIKAWNEGEISHTPIAFHSDDCCGCCDFYFSRLKQDIIAVCNECGVKRRLMLNDPAILSIIGSTSPFDIELNT